MLKSRKSSKPAVPLKITDQGCFFVGGRYTKTKDGEIRIGQMFVQYQVPAGTARQYPIVLWHGGGQTGANYLGTPDGRKGWAEFFLRRGYTVYVVDQSARGRSGFFTEVYGKTRRPSTGAMSMRFTAPERAKLYPQAVLHTQWPGKGVSGDPVFDQFFSSQVEDIENFAVIEQLNRDAGVALLERIGPAILLTHSQSGPIGWEIADARPKLVRALLAIEPNGPPFYENDAIGAPHWFADGVKARPWGITRIPLTYSPPVRGASGLAMRRQQKPDGPGLARCWLQQEPARQLPNLQKVPILMVTGEASYHASYDHATSQFLRQAGVAHDYVRLRDVGIRGNGHMMMLEKNNIEIAEFLESWLRKKLEPRRARIYRGK